MKPDLSIVILLVPLLLLGAIACSKEPPPNASVPVEAPGVESVVNAYLEAKTHGDLEALAELYHESVISITGPFGPDPETAFVILTGKAMVLEDDRLASIQNPVTWRLDDAAVVGGNLTGRISAAYDALEAVGLNPITGMARYKARERQITSIAVTWDDESQRKLEMVMAPVPLEVVGRWEGARLIDGVSQDMTVYFEPEGVGPRAKIDIPQQGVTRLLLVNVSYDAGTVRFEVRTGLGLATWEGQLKDDTISGDIRHPERAGIFRLEPCDTGRAESLRRARVPFPERSGNPHRHADLPATDGPHPVVVLIGGSGPQDRDQTIAGFKMFRALADYLTRNGVAVLRHDDRGVGGSTGALYESTVDNLAGDVLAAVEALKRHPRIDTRRIGLVGHGEGGIIASLVASHSDDVSYIVMTAGPGVRGEQLVRAQNRSVLRTLGASEETIRRESRFADRIFEAVRTDEGWDELRADLRESVLESMDYLPEEQRFGTIYIEEFLTTIVDPRLELWRSPWYASFLDFDPSSVLERLMVPVLAVFGELDYQVPAEMNAAAISRSLEKAGNRDFTVVTLAGANHLFQKAETGSYGEYSKLEKGFVPGFLGLIRDWLLERTAVEPAVP